MNEETSRILLEAIAADKLTALCGAGLSMAPPSSVPSAAAVAATCAAKYAEQVPPGLPAEQAGDIEKMALWFRGNGRLEDLFLRTLVPWGAFNTEPNAGHYAVGDFLGCQVIREATTTNFDTLIENAATALGDTDFRAVVDVSDLSVTRPHSPLLKVHGCGTRGREATIWCKEQLTAPALVERASRFKTWLETQLLGRDILIVGFWSDWDYLLELFAASLPALGGCNVVLVTPASSDELQRKAPSLWTWTHGPNVRFIHEPESGATFLDDLRRRVSRIFVNRVCAAAGPTYVGLFEEPLALPVNTPEDLTSEDLYALRRDLTGTPRNVTVREKQPRDHFHRHAAIHQRLMDKGAHYSGHIYDLNGRRLRLISGHGNLMSVSRAKYSNEPPLPSPTMEVVCVGGTIDPFAANVIRPDEPPGILTPGTPLTWATDDALVAELRGA